jgi:hypothetical protein
MKNPSYSSLLGAIRAKCQQESWFGADLDHSRWYTVDPDFDSFEEQEKQINQVSDHPQCFAFAFAPATAQQVETTEQILGFSLPPLLKALYTQIANGGFGPGTGLRGIAGGYDGTYHDGGTLLNLYPSSAKSEQLFDLASNQQGWQLLPEGQWPRRLLRLADMGCVQEACVDAASEHMYLLVVTTDGQHALVSLPWNLEEWLWRWVKGKPLTEYYPPEAA